MKKYAIVHPAQKTSVFGPANLTAFFVIPYHKLTYDQICGYSLGHVAEFCDTLDRAKRHFHVPPHGDIDFFYNSQDAIVEVNVENDQITSFGKIYEIAERLEHLRKYEASIDNKILTHPTWNERDIKANEISRGALNEMNKQFHSTEKTQRVNRP